MAMGLGAPKLMPGAAPRQGFAAWSSERGRCPQRDGVRLLRAGPLTALVCCTALLMGCGSSNSASQITLDRSCQQLSGVLSNGPDPTADPVGYAEAQILPLRGVHVDEGSLQRAINQLDDAYEQEYSTSGAATKAVANASARLNDICSGAAP
jgi:hypothetical protein